MAETPHLDLDTGEYVTADGGRHGFLPEDPPGQQERFELVHADASDAGEPDTAQHFTGPDGHRHHLVDIADVIEHYRRKGKVFPVPEQPAVAAAVAPVTTQAVPPPPPAQ